MSAEELRSTVRQSPFEPFRLVMTDGATLDVTHPDFIMVGRHSAIVGIAKKANDDLFDRTIKVDLLHIVRIEPLNVSSENPSNGSAGTRG